MSTLQPHVKEKIGYILSALSRELFEIGSRPPKFLTDNIEQYVKSYPVPDMNDLQSKAEKLIQRLREKTTYFGEPIELGDIQTAYPLAYAKNENEFKALLRFLDEKKLTQSSFVRDSDVLFVGATLLADGWELSNRLEKSNESSEQGFIASWFHETTDESILAIEEAIRETGHEAICIKDEHFSERIMDKALGEIRKSRFVVVDLTGNRGSVFFEAGFAMGLNIEAIYVYKDTPEEGSPLDFYVRHYQCYKYSSPNELKEILKAAIQARIVKK